MKSIFAIIVLLVLAAGPGFGADQQGQAYLVLTDGTPHLGELLSLDDSTVRLRAADGRVVEVDRGKVALINLHPEWVVMKAYGTKDNVYYDFASGLTVTLPTDGWACGYDSEGHLFITSPDGRLTLGFYAYTSRFASLDVFLATHAAWRKASGVPEASYTGGEAMQIDGQPARAFAYETAGAQGRHTRMLDVKTIGPLGHGLVLVLMGSDLTAEEFDQARQSILPIIQGIHFLRPVS